MDKKYILAIAVSVLFAGLVGFYAGRFYEVKTARKRFVNMRGGQQGQRFVRPEPRTTEQVEIKVAQPTTTTAPTK